MIRIALDKLEAEIRKTIDSEIDKIKVETKKELRKIKEGFENRAGEQAEKIKKDGEVEKEMILRRILADSNTQVKEMINAEKNRLIDEVFDEAGNIILNLDDKEKKKILDVLSEEGRAEIKNPVILVDKEYKGLLKGAKAADLGDFGVVITDRDKKVRIDNTLQSRLNQLRKTLRPRVASILFIENGEAVSDR